ncbi:hypothetical protein [Natrinema sp. H-ect4]|uniref:hypothetical protein n=1 Tax=Natrinema sp. H-ect4 TaxID=3242699 RepID=UPI0035A91A0B
MTAAAQTDPVGAAILLLCLAAIGLYFAYLSLRESYRQEQLWNHIAEDDNLPDPLEILYTYKAKEVENQQ